MPSFHIRRRDNDLIPCTDSHGRQVEHCRMHGDNDIHAESLEEAYEIMNQKSQYGLREESINAYSSVSAIQVEEQWPSMRGSGNMVAGLLRNHRSWK